METVNVREKKRRGVPCQIPKYPSRHDLNYGCSLYEKVRTDEEINIDVEVARRECQWFNRLWRELGLDGAGVDKELRRVELQITEDGVVIDEVWAGLNQQLVNVDRQR